MFSQLKYFKNFEIKSPILVIDFGGQYSQIIARKVRELGVYCKILPFDFDFKNITEKKLSGIILSGGPKSVNEKNAPSVSSAIFNLGVPILGICYGAQLIAKHFGGTVEPGVFKEYGKTVTEFDVSCKLFRNIKKTNITWMSHFDSVVQLPSDFKTVAWSKNTKIAAMQRNETIFAVQFHPEVSHTECGTQIISNFLFNVCNCEKNWNVSEMSTYLVKSLQNKIKNKKVLLALSGGVDSCVLAALLSKAIGKKLTAVFVDNGLMRQNEVCEVTKTFADWNMNFVVVDAATEFLSVLKGITDPEKKRQVVGEQFIRVFEKEAAKIGKVDFFAQGTIYSDVIESGGIKNNASLIKSHHNVGGLPEHVDFNEIIEPLKCFFKDEVRQIGKELNLPPEIVNRQPFPGPGLSIRILGEVTPSKLQILREADAIFRQELTKHGLDKKASQYFAVLSNTKSVGVKGDERVYEHIIILRAVETVDFMTASFCKVPYDVLEIISARIVNEVKGAGRVLFDITTKPPATIEFE